MNSSTGNVEFAECGFSAILRPKLKNSKAEIGIGFKVWYTVSANDSPAPVLYSYVAFSLTTQGLLGVPKSKEISISISVDWRLDKFPR